MGASMPDQQPTQQQDRVIVISAVKHDTRVMVPREYEKFREQLSIEYKLLADASLHTGMRMVELQNFMLHPKWFFPAARCIDLPRYEIENKKQVMVIKKKKCIHKQRSVRLSVKGVEAIEALLKAEITHMPSRSAMNEAFKRAAKKAGISERGITPKMFRKTLISWLVQCFPEKHILIAMHSGHSVEVMQENYLGTNFERNDIEDMKSYVRGWGE
jgi:integrase